jgi:MFS family permease
MEKNVGRGPLIHYGWIVMAMGMLTAIGAHGFGRMAYTLILPSMKDGLHFTYAQLGLLGTGNFIGYLTFAIIGGLSIFCGLIWGGFSDLLGRKYGFALAYLTLAVAYAVLALIKSSIGFYFSAVIFGLTAWSIPTIMAAAAGDYVGPRLAPAGLGFITLFFGIGQALGPALGGYLADATQSFAMPFLLASSVSLSGAISSLYLGKPKKDVSI